MQPHPSGEAYLCQFVYEGRGFTRLELLQAVIAASGRKVVGLALVWEEREIWQVIELIETMTGLGQDEIEEDDWS